MRRHPKYRRFGVWIKKRKRGSKSQLWRGRFAKRATANAFARKIKGTRLRNGKLKFSSVRVRRYE